LFSYLLIFRDRPHPRETLAGLFWGNQSISRSKKYLRQALWQIQATLVPDHEAAVPLLVAEPEWVMLNSNDSLWLDVVEFEQAINLMQDKPGMQLDDQDFQNLTRTARLYQGDLLEGCYQDWCLYERERLQNMYLALLDKLIDYCEAYQKYDTGLAYGVQILRFDRARERTHRRLMRLYYLAGNRTDALRQYQNCVEALKEELDVEPSRRTMELYEQIRRDHLGEKAVQPVPRKTTETPTKPLSEVLERLKQLYHIIHNLQEEIQDDIQVVEKALNKES
jgi:DNA-binding SARP family transcriptional activator